MCFVPPGIAVVVLGHRSYAYANILSQNTGFLGDAKEKTENVALLFFAIDEGKFALKQKIK